MSIVDDDLPLGRFKATQRGPLPKGVRPMVFSGTFIEGRLELMLEMHRLMGMLQEKAVLHEDQYEPHFAPIYCRSKTARFQRALLADPGSFKVEVIEKI